MFVKMKKNERVLIVSSRNPLDGLDTDGGCMTALNVWDSLRGFADVDFLIPISCRGLVLQNIAQIHTYTDSDELTLSKCGTQRFYDRISVSGIVAERIRELSPQYDKIIILHVFHAFGLCMPEDGLILRKTVVFPMFLTPSYLLCGENVPSAYTELERSTLLRVGKIITPSQFEREQLTEYYGIQCRTIKVIPRYVSGTFSPNRPRKAVVPLAICYVASIKEQKRHLLALELLDLLMKMGLDVRLYLVGTVFDDALYERMTSFLTERCMEENVVFRHSLCQSDLDELFSRMFLNISVTSCETFGRAIIEGLYTGLPAVVLNEIRCFKQLIGVGNGVEYGESIEDVANIISRLYHNEIEYERLCRSASRFGSRFSVDFIQPRLRDELCK